MIDRQSASGILDTPIGILKNLLAATKAARNNVGAAKKRGIYHSYLSIKALNCIILGKDASGILDTPVGFLKILLAFYTIKRNKPGYATNP